MDWLYPLTFASGENTVQRDFGSAGRGMVYTRDVKKNDELFIIPNHAMVYTSNPHLHSTTQKVLTLFRSARGARSHQLCTHF